MSSAPRPPAGPPAGAPANHSAVPPVTPSATPPMALPGRVAAAVPAGRSSMRRYGWVALLYFAQGLPFGLVNNAMPLAFSKLGVSLQNIGLLALAGLPWTFKFLWAPLVDRFGQRRHWMAACLALMALLVVAFGVRFGGSVSPLIWALVIGVALLSATQDIAIDAGTIEMLEERELGPANGIRVTAYRVALIAAGSGVPIVAGMLSWRAAWVAAALVLTALAACTLWIRPVSTLYVRPRPAELGAGAAGPMVRSLLLGMGVPLLVAGAFYALAGRAGAATSLRTPLAVLIGLIVAGVLALRGARSTRAAAGADVAGTAGVAGSAGPATGSVARASDDGMRRLLARPSVLAVLLFALTFKLGDAAMTMMTFPFLDRGAHLSATEIGLLLGTFGIAANIVGALLGGFLTTRWGIFRALWVLGLFQAVSNFGYAFAALHPSRPVVWGAAVLEAFCGGLGTAPFLAFLMSVCEKAHAATQYAFLSAVYGLSRSVAGAFSGFAAQPLGFGPYFAVTFLLALPAFALLPALRRGWRAPIPTGAS